MTVNGPALWANVKRANAYSEAKVEIENDETGTGAPLLMGVSGVLGGGRRIDLGAKHWPPDLAKHRPETIVLILINDAGKDIELATDVVMIMTQRGGVRVLVSMECTESAEVIARQMAWARQNTASLAGGWSSPPHHSSPSWPSPAASKSTQMQSAHTHSK